MWTILRDYFNYISPLSMSYIFVDMYNIKFLECKDVINYTGQDQIAFDKIISLTSKEFWMSKKNIEMMLQKSLLRHFGKDYFTLVSIIKTF